MIEEAWNQYRGWAARARSLQTSANRWTMLAMTFAVLAAVLGTLASQLPAGNGARIVGFLAGVAAALTPILGKDILEVKREAGWIRARATAEAIKSECYRYASAAGDYAAADADAKFNDRCAALVDPALRAGLTPLPDPVQGNDNRRPARPMTTDWYLTNRLQEQRDRFFSRGQSRHERAVSNLRTAGLALAAVAAILGVAGASFGALTLTPWIGVATTLGALVVAQGLLERRQYLAATYGAMTVRLSQVETRYSGDLQKLVTQTEDLLGAEHAAWSERMDRTIPAPPAVVPHDTHGPSLPDPLNAGVTPPPSPPAQAPTAPPATPSAAPQPSPGSHP
jgi:hypothetical protein